MTRELKETADFLAMILLFVAMSVLPVAAPARAGDEHQSEDRDRDSAYGEDQHQTEGRETDRTDRDKDKNDYQRSSRPPQYPDSADTQNNSGVN